MSANFLSQLRQSVRAPALRPTNMNRPRDSPSPTFDLADKKFKNRPQDTSDLPPVSPVERHVLKILCL